MNFNHLISRAELIRPCVRGAHVYYPTGHIEAMLGGNIAIRFRCKRCNQFITSFLDHSEYEVHKNVINKYIEAKGA